MTNYAVIESNTIVAMFRTSDLSSVSLYKVKYPSAIIVQTKFFGDAQNFMFDGKEVAIRSEKPSPFYKFNTEKNEWYDARSLQDAKAAGNMHVNASRQQANLSSFVFAGKAISVDNLGRSDIDDVLGIVALTNNMPDGWKGAWKAIDNTYVSIPDVATWKLFYAAMVAQGSANFYHAQTLKSQIEKAITIAEVEAIVW